MVIFRANKKNVFFKYFCEFLSKNHIFKFKHAFYVLGNVLVKEMVYLYSFVYRTNYFHRYNYFYISDF